MRTFKSLSPYKMTAAERELIARLEQAPRPEPHPRNPADQIEIPSEQYMAVGQTTTPPPSKPRKRR